MLAKVKFFFESHPKAKASLIHAAKVGAFVVLSAVVTDAARGAFGPEAAKIGAAIIALYALYTRRPQDSK